MDEEKHYSWLIYIFGCVHSCVTTRCAN